ncbi:MAG: Do family serine endopeptidase [Pseudomonadota bacterium]
MTKTRATTFALFALFAMAATAHAQLPRFVKGEPVTSLAPLVEEVAPAVVNIRVVQRVSRQNPLGNNDLRRFFGLPDTPQGGTQDIPSAGSGVIVDAERGLILTNHHVVGEADEIQISLFDGTVLDAEFVGSDPGTDIAVIRVEADGLVDMPIGDSNIARVGDFVLAIGNPFGLDHTVTSGIISALGRTGISREGYEDFIQTDASINPGNSGGALVNMNGELIGINSAIISRSGGNVGIGFAVPTEIASSIMNQILDYGEIRRGLLGVNIQTVDSEAAEALGSSVDGGVLITGVNPGSGADEAGLQAGDIVTELNGEKVMTLYELRNKVGLMRSGDKVNLTWYRDDERFNADATLGSLDNQLIRGETIHEGLAGSVFAAATTTEADGVEIAEVEDGSAAAQRGLRTGDLITRVNRIPVSSLNELRQVAQRYRILFLNVRRGDRDLMFQIR